MTDMNVSSPNSAASPASNSRWDALVTRLHDFQERVNDIAKRILSSPLTPMTTGMIALGGAIAAAVLNPITAPAAIAVAVVALAVLGVLAVTKRKEIIFEISLTYNIALNALNPKSYQWWNKVDDHLILGAIPLKNKGHMEAIEADAVLTCLEDFEVNAYTYFGVPVRRAEWEEKGVEVHQIKTPDFQPLSQKELAEGVEFIHQQELKGKTTYVHCKAGRGRSASVAVCYLIKHKGFNNMDAAIESVRVARPQVNINARQREAITTYAASLRNQ